MKILMLAPHPFYQARGTPIAADLVLSVLSKRGDQVDLVTFPEGSDVHYSGLAIYRTPNFRWLQNIRPGFSLKKIVCDVFLMVQALKLARRDRYDLIHAGEEAVFIALAIQKLFGIPYVYDMDSSLVQQLTDKMPRLRIVEKPLRACERLAVRNASAVLAVCQALKDEIAPYRPRKVAVIPDISLLNQPTRVSSSSSPQEAEPPVAQLRQAFDIQGELLMYVGNLESYQGIDLLLASFAKALAQAPTAHLVVIGGTSADIHKYQMQANQLNISAQVHFAGPKPITQLKPYLDQADIVVSPRTQGNNTPMKLYSYLDSGKALLATNLTTHTQVLNEHIACLAEPETSAFANGIVQLITHPDMRANLGQAAQAYIAQAHTYEAFSRSLTALYGWVESESLKTHRN
jgi:glycosyltransferase involved in cell wall biosynthesis